MSGSSGLSIEAMETRFREEIEAKKVFECAHHGRAYRWRNEELPPMAQRRFTSPASEGCLTMRRPSGVCWMH
jgi:hypothetical protein